MKSLTKNRIENVEQSGMQTDRPLFATVYYQLVYSTFFNQFVPTDLRYLSAGKPNIP